MELTLTRLYYPAGTNGLLQDGGLTICRTIELPWRYNLANLSCIPEGRYALRKRYSRRHGHHLLVTCVPGRSLILIHPANNAVRELQGCIAPVTGVTGEGVGTGSRMAFDRLMELVCPRLDEEPVWLQVRAAGTGTQPAPVVPLFSGVALRA